MAVVDHLPNAHATRDWVRARELVEGYLLASNPHPGTRRARADTLLRRHAARAVLDLRTHEGRKSAARGAARLDLGGFRSIFHSHMRAVRATRPRASDQDVRAEARRRTFCK